MIQIFQPERFMSRHLCRVTVALLLSVASAVGLANPSSNEVAIRDVESQQALAWNRHNAEEYASLFAEDGDVVNVLGWWWQGRAAISAKLADAFTWVFRESTLTIDDVHIRFLDPSTAVVHVRWTMEGSKAPPGAPSPPRQGIQLQILRKVKGQWLIASFQNTNSAPELPFPKGPASPSTLNPS
jgi:uncharacterized protein (TIGR02246 family)